MNRWVKRTGIAAGGLVGIAALALATVYGISNVKMAKSYAFAITPLTTQEAADQIERGRHVAVAIGKCVDCHGKDLGGLVLIDDPAIGRLSGPNLTSGRGGIADGYTDEDYIRAIRHGVAKNGRALLFMPSDEYFHFSDADLRDLITYLKNLPPVDREPPPSRLGPLGRVLYVTGQMPVLSAERIEHGAVRQAAVEPAVTEEYGAYLAMVGGCVGCHGPGLSGGRVPGTPPDFPAATNITPEGIGNWTEEDFFRAFRSGIRPDGSAIDPFMPWEVGGQMTDEELRALWLYLKSVPPRATGTR